MTFPGRIPACLVITAALGTVSAPPPPTPAPTAPAAAPRPEPPSARAGPYRIVVERLTLNQSLQSLFAPTVGPEAPARTGRRSAHVQLKLLAETPEAAAAVETFSIHAVTILVNGRREQIPHYGGPLEELDDAVLRVYVYATDVGLQAAEIRSIEGEITVFEKAGVISASLPLDVVPAAVVVEGVEMTTQQCVSRGGGASVRLLVRPPARTQVVAAGSDGTYGIRLLGEGGFPATPGSSTMSAATDGSIQFDLNFQGLQGSPRVLEVQMVTRRGARRVLPFQVEHIPLPGRSAPAPPARN